MCVFVCLWVCICVYVSVHLYGSVSPCVFLCVRVYVHVDVRIVFVVVLVDGTVYDNVVLTCLFKTRYFKGFGVDKTSLDQ